MTPRLLIVVAALSLGGCYGLAGDDEMSRYLQRSDSITMSAGDAKQVNAVTHTIHPWPRYVEDRRIASDAHDPCRPLLQERSTMLTVQDRTDC